jgi:hypothetical protein
MGWQEWRERNPEKSKAAKEAWNMANPEKCKEYARRYYQANRETADRRGRDHQQQWYAWKKSLKIGKTCVDCAWECTEDNYPAFDWDHRPGETKLFAVSKAGAGRDKVLAEVAKCDLRCRNCHAIITHQRGQHKPGSKIREVAGL